MESLGRLDNWTLVFTISIECFSLSFLSALLYVCMPLSKGILRWAAGNALLGLSFALICAGFSGALFEGQFLSNVLFVAGFCCLMDGTHAFLGMSRRLIPILYLPIVFSVFLFYWLTFIQPSQAGRTIVLQAVVSLQCLHMGTVLFARYPCTRKAPARYTAAVYLLTALWFIVQPLERGLGLTSLLRGHFSALSFTLLVFIVAPLAWTFGLLLMTLSRKLEELAVHEAGASRRAQDRMIRQIIDTMPEHIVLKGLASEYLFCNRTFARGLGLTVEELEGRSDLDTMPAEKAAFYHAQDKEVMESGHMISVLRNEGIDGREVWQETIKAPLRGEDGSIEGVLVVFRDVTDRIQAERALQESEQRYRELSGALERKVEERTEELKGAKRDIDLFFCVTLEFLCIIDFEGRLLKVSPAWHKELGWREDELIGRFMRDFLHPDDVENVTEMRKLLIQGTREASFQNRCRRSDGSYIWLAWSAVGVPNRQLIIGSAHDITSRVLVERQLDAAREEAEDASRRKSQFIATMSHELRTPLNAVLGYSLLLDSLVPAGKGQNYLRSITSAGRSLLAIINDILDYTKVESGRITLKLIPFDPRGLLRELKDIFRFSAEEKGISLSLEASEATPRSILLDPDKLRQILINLIGNAIKFTESGSVTVRLDARNEGPPGDEEDLRSTWKATLMIEVIDTGIGIDGAYRKRLFEPFSQQDPEIAHRFGGAGLGLAIAKRLLDLMGGFIRFEESERGGSHFSIEIPAVLAAGKTDETVIALAGTTNRGRKRPERALLDLEQAQSELMAAQSQIETLVSRLNWLSSFDELTGMLNRKAIATRLQQEAEAAVKEGGNLAVILGNFDHFKRINDSYGLTSGDAILQEAARRFSSGLSEADILGRWGNGEFLAILPGSDREIALEKAEKILALELDLPFFVAGETISLSLSMGVGFADAASPVSESQSCPGALVSSLLRSAEDALYRAQMKGRGRVEVVEISWPLDVSIGAAQPTPPSER